MTNTVVGMLRDNVGQWQQLEVSLAVWSARLHASVVSASIFPTNTEVL